MKNMKTKRIQIKDLSIGDRIKTYNNNNEIVFKTVTDVFISKVEASNQRIIKTQNGTELICSNNHPIMVNSGGQLEEVMPDDLTSEMTLVGGNGIMTKISSVKANNNVKTEDFVDITVEDTHTFFASKGKNEPMILTHNSQGGVRGGAATLHTVLWHYEIEEILVLKNNKGTQDNRVRKIDYSILINDFLYKRLINDGNVTLFSPNDVPDMYDAFYEDTEKFAELYEKYERDNSIRKKVISARELFSSLMIERKETGRIYVMNIDHSNDHSTFTVPIKMSNLCVTGDTVVSVFSEKTGLFLDTEIENLGELLHDIPDLQVCSHNINTGKDVFSDILDFAMTNENAEIVRITDEETNNTIEVTPEHKVFTKNRGYVMAKDLVETDLLLMK